MKKLRPNMKKLLLKRSKKVMKRRAEREEKGVFYLRLSRTNKIKAIVKREHR